MFATEELLIEVFLFIEDIPSIESFSESFKKCFELSQMNERIYETILLHTNDEDVKRKIYCHYKIGTILYNKNIEKEKSVRCLQQAINLDLQEFFIPLRNLFQIQKMVKNVMETLPMKETIYLPLEPYSIDVLHSNYEHDFGKLRKIQKWGNMTYCDLEKGWDYLFENREDQIVVPNPHVLLYFFSINEDAWLNDTPLDQCSASSKVLSNTYVFNRETVARAIDFLKGFVDDLANWKNVKGLYKSYKV